ncbi:MAG: hypothetical protein ACE5PO_06020 [Candidatus Bathyarchaeia archaeon]
MKVRSKGLGKMELEFNMGAVRVTRENGQLIVQGKTVAPVVWDFRITVTEEELPHLMKLATCKKSTGFFIRWLCNRSIDRFKFNKNRKPETPRT